MAHAVHHIGQHLQRRDHAVELAATVVADHNTLRADVGGHHGIVFVEDALDDEVATPALANALDMLPVQVVAARGVADGGVGQQGCAACGKRVLEVRHAVVDQRAQHGAHHPAWTDDAVVGQTQRGAQRHGEAGAHIVFAVGPDGNVHGDDQRAKASGCDAVDQSVDARGVAGQVGLEPGGRRGLGYVFHGNQGGAAHDGGNAVGGSGLRQHQIATVGIDGADAHGGHAKRRVPGLPEQLDLLVALGHVHHDLGAEAVLLKAVTVGMQGHAIFGGARDIAKQGAGQVFACCVFKVVQRQNALQMTRKPGALAVGGLRFGGGGCVGSRGL